MAPDAPLASRLPQLIADASPRVASLALKSAARLKREDALPAVIERLEDPRTAGDAAETLQRYGDLATGALARSLRDPELELILKSAVADALGRIGSREAAGVLVGELESGHGELDAAVIDALDRLRAEHDEIRLPADVVGRKTLAMAGYYARTFIDLERLGRGPGTEAFRNRLEANLGSCRDNIFMLLGMAYPEQDIRAIYQNIVAGRPHAVAHAVEWLDNALRKDLRDALLPIVEDLEPGERAKRFQKFLKNSPGR
jgi:hypothetical protein